jgi:aminoglycoside phosphotransferase (APT) family kinase protein
MSNQHHMLPQLDDLRAALQASLGANNGGSDVRVIARAPDKIGNTFPNEVVTCVVRGRKVRFFCKYSGDVRNTAHGHRGGIAYEVQVYRDVLEALRLGTPRYHGSYTHSGTGETWLFVEHIDGADRLSWAIQRQQLVKSETMKIAARWLAHFHVASGAIVADAKFITDYDGDYYRGWVRRTARYSRSLATRYPWLADACARLEEWVDVLAAVPRVIVHGEFYPKNVLYRSGRVHPVDWESAARGVGEIDLAALTENWGETIARACEEEYMRVRWPGGAPPSFHQTLAGARLYLHTRWLGDTATWAKSKKTAWRFDDLRLLSEQLGLI